MKIMWTINKLSWIKYPTPPWHYSGPPPLVRNSARSGIMPVYLALFRTALAVFRTGLAVFRTGLAAFRTTLAVFRTALAVFRTALAVFRTTFLIILCLPRVVQNTASAVRNTASAVRNTFFSKGFLLCKQHSPSRGMINGPLTRTLQRRTTFTI